MNRVTVAIDVMGGDHGPSVTVPASLKAIQDHPQLTLVLVGNETQIKNLLNGQSYDASRLKIHHTSQSVEMDEGPTQALRYKKDSSMRVAINMVKEGQASACVSAGNTGALMAMAHFVLKTINGVDRPAIISSLPAYKKPMRMLDLGANVDSSANNLLQFAIMGSVLASKVDDIPSPSVYLLNIGEEVIKGNRQVKETAQLLKDHQALNYKGFIEGDVLFNSDADIVVCDGFVGNIALKSSGGAALFIIKLLKDGFRKNILTRLIGAIALPILKGIMKKIDPSTYNGATFLGLKGVVIKSHGRANIEGFHHAILEAKNQVEKDVLHFISDEIEKILQNSPAGKSL